MAQSGERLWVMAYHTATSVGSVSHVSNGDKLYPSEAECQRAIDTMTPWIGMGDPKRYRPLVLEVA